MQCSCYAFASLKYVISLRDPLACSLLFCSASLLPASRRAGAAATHILLIPDMAIFFRR